MDPHYCCATHDDHTLSFVLKIRVIRVICGQSFVVIRGQRKSIIPVIIVYRPFTQIRVTNNLPGTISFPHLII